MNVRFSILLFAFSTFCWLLFDWFCCFWVLLFCLGVLLCFLLVFAFLLDFAFVLLPLLLDFWVPLIEFSWVTTPLSNVALSCDLFTLSSLEVEDWPFLEFVDCLVVWVTRLGTLLFFLPLGNAGSANNASVSCDSLDPLVSLDFFAFAAVASRFANEPSLEPVSFSFFFVTKLGTSLSADLGTLDSLVRSFVFLATWLSLVILSFFVLAAVAKFSACVFWWASSFLPSLVVGSAKSLSLDSFLIAVWAIAISSADGFLSLSICDASWLSSLCDSALASCISCASGDWSANFDSCWIAFCWAVNSFADGLFCCSKSSLVASNLASWISWASGDWSDRLLSLTSLWIATFCACNSSEVKPSLERFLKFSTLSLTELTVFSALSL